MFSTMTFIKFFFMFPMKTLEVGGWKLYITLALVSPGLGE